MTKLMKDVFELPLEVRDDLVFFAKSDTCFVKVESVASRKEELYVSRAVHDAINTHDTLVEQNKQLVEALRDLLDVTDKLGDQYACDNPDVDVQLVMDVQEVGDKAIDLLKPIREQI